MMISPSIPVLMIGRMIVGVGVGIAAFVVPLYLAENSPIQVRGTVVAVDVLMITTGQFISSFISLLCGNNWRLMLGLAAIPSILQLIGMLFMPESTRWLAK